MKINNTVSKSAASLDITAIAREKLAKTGKKLAENSKAVEDKVKKANAAKLAILQHDTVFSMAYAVNGHTVVADVDLEGNETEPQLGSNVIETEDGDVALTAEATSILAVYAKILADMENPKHHMSYYTNPSAVLRLSGMWKRASEAAKEEAKTGKPSEIEALSDGQIAYIAEDLKHYGTEYVTLCYQVFSSMKDAIKAGKTLSFHDKSVVDVNRTTEAVEAFYPLRYAIRNSAAVGHTVHLNNGYGELSLGGSKVKVSTVSKVTGDFKLVLAPSGAIAVERKLDGNDFGTQLIKNVIGPMYKNCFKAVGDAMKEASADKALSAANGLDEFFAA